MCKLLMALKLAPTPHTHTHQEGIYSSHLYRKRDNAAKRTPPKLKVSPSGLYCHYWMVLCGYNLFSSSHWSSSVKPQCRRILQLYTVLGVLKRQTQISHELAASIKQSLEKALRRKCTTGSQKRVSVQHIGTGDLNWALNTDTKPRSMVKEGTLVELLQGSLGYRK